MESTMKLISFLGFSVLVKAQLENLLGSLTRKIQPEFLPFALADLQLFPSLKVECSTRNLPKIASIEDLRAQRGNYLCYWAAGRTPSKPFKGMTMMYILEMNNSSGIISTYYNTFVRNKILFSSRCRDPTTVSQPAHEIDLGLVFRNGQPGFWFKPLVGKINMHKKLRSEEFNDDRESLLYFYDVDWTRECADEFSADGFPRNDFNQLNGVMPNNIFFESLRIVGQTNEPRPGYIYLIRVFVSEIGLNNEYGTIGYVALISYDDTVSLLPLDQAQVTPQIQATQAGLNQLITIPGILSSGNDPNVRKTVENVLDIAAFSSTLRPLISIPDINTLFGLSTNPITQLLLTPGSGGTLTGSGSTTIADALGIGNLLRGGSPNIPINGAPRQ
eukprot:GDKJ01042311.1.p1 GENE.GDKJ01042311.1~~GDKJ01042311.1.p1  ORF type:complete len:388 (+),score=43.77 GDKJ01042311.1:256-1419(+)